MDGTVAGCTEDDEPGADVFKYLVMARRRYLGATAFDMTELPPIPRALPAATSKVYLLRRRRRIPARDRAHLHVRRAAGEVEEHERLRRVELQKIRAAQHDHDVLIGRSHLIGSASSR